jgi:hypothetical protein
VAQQVFKTCAVWQPHARSVRLRRRSVKPISAFRRALPRLDACLPCASAGRQSKAVAECKKQQKADAAKFAKDFKNFGHCVKAGNAKNGDDEDDD